MAYVWPRTLHALTLGRWRVDRTRVTENVRLPRGELPRVLQRVRGLKPLPPFGLSATRSNSFSSLVYADDWAMR
jgi:hypothetical protein